MNLRYDTRITIFGDWRIWPCCRVDGMAKYLSLWNKWISTQNIKVPLSKINMLWRHQKNRLYKTLVLKKKQTLRSNAKSSRGWWLRLCWLMDTGAREPATLQRKQSKQPLCRPRLLWKRRAAIFEGSLNINSHALRTDRNLRPLKFNGCVLKFKYVTSLRPYT